MNFLELLQSALNGDDIDVLRTEVLKLSTAYIKEFDTLQNNNNKLTNEIKDRNDKIDSLNVNLNDIKGLLGIGENIPLNKELIESKLNNTDDLQKVEDKYNEIITKLHDTHNTTLNDVKTQLASKESEIYNLQLDNKISHIIPQINPNDGALEDIIRYIKQGAIIKDNGDIAFKENDIILRNEKGFELTILDRVDELKKTRKYLFSSKINEGGNIPNTGGTVLNPNGLSTFGLRMQQRAKQI